MNTINKYILKNKYELLFILFIMFIITANSSLLLFINISSLIISFILPVLCYFHKIRFKIINTLILTISTITVSSNLFNYSINVTTIVAIIKVFMLYFTLVLNIFLVTKELYQVKINFKKNYYGMKLLYVIVSFILLTGTVVISYSLIYENIWFYNPNSFSLDNVDFFPSMYYSSTTFFTVGYGDIIPISYHARLVSMSQMFLSYLITCLILPSVLVAFQKLFQDKSDISNNYDFK